MRLVRGDELTSAARAEVLRAYVHRLTTENGYPGHNPCGARIPAVTDQRWLADHAFWVTRAGKLARNRHYAEQAFMATP